jgi:hypothetical protein
LPAIKVIGNQQLKTICFLAHWLFFISKCNFDVLKCD